MGSTNDQAAEAMIRMAAKTPAIHPAFLAALTTEQQRRDPRKIWIILKGGTLPLVMDAWQLKQADAELHAVHMTAEGETPVYRTVPVVVDYTPKGEIRMVVDLSEIVAIKFYEH